MTPSIEGLNLEHEISTQEQLFLLHIPKTGGVTLDTVIQQHFDLQTIAPPLYTPLLLHNQISADFFESYTYYRGHVYFDLMQALIGDPILCLTLLRDPTERFLSQFSYMQRLPDKFLKYHLGLTRQEVEDFEAVSLDEFVFDSQMVHQPNYQNYQSRLIGSSFDFEEDDDPQLFLKAIDTEPPANLDLARKRLSQLTFLGLTERFQDSLFLLAYTFGWPPHLNPPRLNTAPTRLQQDQVAPKTLDKIREYNQLDIELYAYAQQLFEDRFTRMCHELLKRYGQSDHAQLSLPLPTETVFDLLQQHYRHRFKARHTPARTISFTFDQAISGTGWHLPEAHATQGIYRWTGPETRSTLDFPLKIDEPLHIQFSVVSVITPDTLNSLRLTVNGEPVALTQYPAGDAVIFEGCLSPNNLPGADDGYTQLAFQIDRTMEPNALDPDNDDDRPVGIALNWLELKPVMAELAHRRSEAKTAVQQQQALEQALSASEELVRSLKSTVQQQEAELDSLSAALNAKTNEAARLQTQLQQQQQAYETLEEAHNQAGDRIRLLEATLRDREAELVSLTSTLDDKTAALAGLRAELQQQAQTHQALQEVYDEAKAYAHSLEEAVQTREAELASLTAALDSKTTKLADLHVQLQHQEQAHQSLQEVYDQAKNYAHSLEKTVQNKQAELASLTAALDDNTNQLNGLRAQLQDQAQAHQKLQEVYNDARDYARSLEKSVQDREAELAELRQQLHGIQESRAYKTGQQLKQLTKIFTSQPPKE